MLFESWLIFFSKLNVQIKQNKNVFPVSAVYFSRFNFFFIKIQNKNELYCVKHNRFI